MKWIVPCDSGGPSSWSKSCFFCSLPRELALDGISVASLDIASSRHVSAPCEHGLVPVLAAGEGFKSSLKRKEAYAGTALSCRTAACLSKTRWFSVFVATWPHDRGRGGPTSAAPCRAHSFHGMSYRARLTNWLTDQLETVPSNWQKVSVKDLVRDMWVRRHLPVQIDIRP